jgi:hypothetical protein
MLKKTVVRDTGVPYSHHSAFQRQCYMRMPSMIDARMPMLGCSNNVQFRYLLASKACAISRQVHHRICCHNQLSRDMPCS